MKTWILICCACALAACSGKPAPAEPKAQPETQAGTPFDTLRASEQRAKDVQKIVNDAAAKQRKAIDQGPQ